jgi:hypothetical protein
MQFTPYGGIAIGYYLPTNNSGSYAPLVVQGVDFAGGIKVNHPGSASSTAVSVYLSNYYDSYAYAYESYGGGSTPNFYVKYNGEVWSTGCHRTSSDGSLKNNVETISSPLDKIMQLRGVTFDLNLPKSETDTEEKQMSDDKIYELLKKRTPTITPEIFKQMREEKSRKQMGVVAQEVEKVIPEVVRTREDGLKAVAYSEMVGLLIEAMKEQQTIIDDLKLAVASLKGNQLRSSETTGMANDLIAACTLAQNTPNPFTEQTEIKYYVTSGVKNAYICIFDMQGKMLQKLDAQAGQNSLFIEGSKLDAGMYLYSLIVDGQEVDTKKMILTK